MEGEEGVERERRRRQERLTMSYSVKIETVHSGDLVKIRSAGA